MNRLRELRKKNGLTADQMAEILGITTRHLYDIETGKVQLAEERINLLCDKFVVKSDWLLGRYIPENKIPSESNVKYIKLAEKCEKLGVSPERMEQLIEIVVETAEEFKTK